MNGINTQFSLIQRTLAQASLEQKVAGQNIANVNTPGYRAYEAAVVPDDLSQGKSYSVRQKENLPARLDGNNVDIDLEIGQLKKSALKHRALTQLLAAKVQQLKHAMSRT